MRMVWMGSALALALAAVVTLPVRGDGETTLARIEAQLKALAGQVSALDRRPGRQAVAQADAALEKASELARGGKHAEATVYIGAALARVPGHAEALRMYARSIRTLAKADVQAKRPDRAARRLGNAEVLLVDQMPHAPLKEIDALRTLLAAIGRERAACERGVGERLPAGASRLTERDRAFVRQVATGALPLGAYENREQIIKLRTRLGDVLDRLDPGEPEISHAEEVAVRALGDRCTLNVRACDLLRRGERLMTRAKTQTSAALASYLLEGAEGHLRSIVQMGDQLFPAIAARIPTYSRALDDGSRTVAADATREKSQRAWREYQSKYGASFERLENWSKPDTDAPDGRCRQHIEKVHAQLRALSATARDVSDPQTAEAMRKHSVVLQDLARAAAVEQQKRYDRWAIQRVKDGFEAGLKHKGHTNDDEVKIADELVKYLGVIDQRLLSPHASRVYQEVFEYFFAELGKPSDQDDFGRKGYKLNALKRLIEGEKKAHRDF